MAKIETYRIRIYSGAKVVGGLVEKLDTDRILQEIEAIRVREEQNYTDVSITAEVIEK